MTCPRCRGSRAVYVVVHQPDSPLAEVVWVEAIASSLLVHYADGRVAHVERVRCPVCHGEAPSEYVEAIEKADALGLYRPPIDFFEAPRGGVRRKGEESMRRTNACAGSI